MLMEVELGLLLDLCFVYLNYYLVLHFLIIYYLFARTCIPVDSSLIIGGRGLLLSAEDPGQRDLGAQEGA